MPEYPDCCLRHQTNGPRGGSCGSLAYTGPEATPDRLTRGEAHRKLLALGMPIERVVHVLNHPNELLNPMRPALTTAASDAAVAIVAAYKRHCESKATPDPLDTVPTAPLTEDELRDIEARTSGPGPLAGDGEAMRRLVASARALRAELVHERHQHTITKGLYDMLLRDAERIETGAKLVRADLESLKVERGDIDARAEVAFHAFEAAMAPVEVPPSLGLQDAWRAVVRTVLAWRPVHREEPVPDSIGPRGSSYDGAHAPRPMPSAPFIPSEEQALHSAACVSLHAHGATERQAIDYLYRESEERLAALVDAAHGAMRRDMRSALDSMAPAVIAEASRAELLRERWIDAAGTAHTSNCSGTLTANGRCYCGAVQPIPGGLTCPGCYAETGVATPHREPPIRCPGYAAHVTARPEDTSTPTPGPAPACCSRAGEYNGFGSDGPTSFTCPAACGCHD